MGKIEFCEIGKGLDGASNSSPTTGGVAGSVAQPQPARRPPHHLAGRLAAVSFPLAARSTTHRSQPAVDGADGDAAGHLRRRAGLGARTGTRTCTDAASPGRDDCGGRLGLQEFTLENSSPLPLLWAAFEDESYLPGYTPGQVASCGAESMVRWKSEAVCRRRGVFRLGPHSLQSGDPFGLFRLHVRTDQQESLLVYPRVVHLPPVDLPRGLTSGRDRRRRPLYGDLRSPTVRLYQPGDSLRRIHWPTTAHRAQLMVAETEEEPSGDLWIVLDLNGAAQAGAGEQSTLETSVILAASLAADLLGSSERRSVGLLTVGAPPEDADTAAEQTILISPQPGRGHLWRILAALAPIQAGRLPVADVLQRNRPFLGKGHTVVVITAQIGDNAPDWIAQLLHLRRSGIDSSVLAVTAAAAPVAASENGADHALAAQQDQLSDLLVRQEIPVRFAGGRAVTGGAHLSTQAHRAAQHAHRRRHREVEEEVG
ncbi:MAG: DUF58 domain-containing protein [Caldilineaceae bacterium]